MSIEARCRVADWVTEHHILMAIRHQVFVEEQGVPVELEGDEHDETATHFVVEVPDESTTRAIATGRLKPDGQIGRMAVLTEYRRSGIGSLLLTGILEHADEHGLTDLYLHSQADATGFYARHGFIESGESFMDAGIPHLAMLRFCAKKSV